MTRPLVALSTIESLANFVAISVETGVATTHD